MLSLGLAGLGEQAKLWGRAQRARRLSLGFPFLNSCLSPGISSQDGAGGAGSVGRDGWRRPFGITRFFCGACGSAHPALHPPVCR